MYEGYKDKEKPKEYLRAHMREYRKLHRQKEVARLEEIAKVFTDYDKEKKLLKAKA